MTTRFDDQKCRSPDDTDNHITSTPNTRNAISLYADEKAAIGKAVDDKTIELEEIEPNDEKFTRRGNSFDCDAVLKEVIIPHVDDLEDHGTTSKPAQHDESIQEAFALQDYTGTWLAARTSVSLRPFLTRFSNG